MNTQTRSKSSDQTKQSKLLFAFTICTWIVAASLSIYFYLTMHTDLSGSEWLGSPLFGLPLLVVLMTVYYFAAREQVYPTDRAWCGLVNLPIPGHNRQHAYPCPVRLWRVERFPVHAHYGNIPADLDCLGSSYLAEGKITQGPIHFSDLDNRFVPPCCQHLRFYDRCLPLRFWEGELCGRCGTGRMDWSDADCILRFQIPVCLMAGCSCWLGLVHVHRKQCEYVGRSLRFAQAGPIVDLQFRRGNVQFCNPGHCPKNIRLESSKIGRIDMKPCPAYEIETNELSLLFDQ